MTTQDPAGLRDALEGHERNLLALGRMMAEPRPDDWAPLLGKRIAAVVNGITAVRDALAATGDSEGPGLDVDILAGVIDDFDNAQLGPWERATVIAEQYAARLSHETKGKATGDSEGPLDVRRVKQAIVNVAKRHGVAPDKPQSVDNYSVASIYGYTTTTVAMDAEIAAEYARLADHAAREGVPEGDLG